MSQITQMGCCRGLIFLLQQIGEDPAKPHRNREIKKSDMECSVPSVTQGPRPNGHWEPWLHQHWHSLHWKPQLTKTGRPPNRGETIWILRVCLLVVLNFLWVSFEAAFSLLLGALSAPEPLSFQVSWSVWRNSSALGLHFPWILAIPAARLAIPIPSRDLNLSYSHARFHQQDPHRLRRQLASSWPFIHRQIW